VQLGTTPLQERDVDHIGIRVRASSSGAVSVPLEWSHR
jgi:hypothetical protein